MDLNQLETADRNRIACAVLLVVLVLGLAFLIPAGPFARYRSARAQVISLNDELLLQEQILQEELLRVERERTLMAKLEARPAGFNFISFLQRVLRQTELSERASANATRERGLSANQVGIDLDLRGVSLKELVDLLHALYASDNLVVLYQMRTLKPAVNGQGLDCSLTLTTLAAQT